MIRIAGLYNWQCDKALSLFDNIDYLERTVLFHKAPQDLASCMTLLCKEGYLEESKYGYKITYKGKLLKEDGGFVRKYIRERIMFFAGVLACLFSAISVAISIFALLK